MSHNRNQNCFTISEVASDWHELIIQQSTLRSSIACISKQLQLLLSPHLAESSKKRKQIRQLVPCLWACAMLPLCIVHESIEPVTDSEGLLAAARLQELACPWMECWFAAHQFHAVHLPPITAVTRNNQRSQTSASNSAATCQI